MGKDDDPLIPKHGGFRSLKTFQLAEIIYDVTVLFCEKYIAPGSRTHDQMVQAARSGRQNIAEASMDSGTSKKSELKLTGIARGSLEELRLDYEDFLRQRELPQWPPDHPALERFKEKRCASLMEFRLWVADEWKRGKRENTDPPSPRATARQALHGQTRTDTDEEAQTPNSTSPDVRESPCQSVSPSVLAANGALSLLNLCIYLLERQMQAQAAAFEKEGGFTERLYRRRSESRKKPDE